MNLGAVDRCSKIVVWALSGSLFLACSSSPPAAEPDPPLDGDQPAAESKADISEVLKKGVQALQDGKLEEAKALLTEAYEKSPQDAQVAYYLGTVHHELESPEQAKKLYEEALKLDPALVEASVNLSGLLLEQQDFANAVVVAEKGLSFDGKRAELLMNRAQALAALKDPRAVDALAPLVDASPDDHQLRLTYAQALSAAAKKDEAIKQATKVVESGSAEWAGVGADTLARIGAFDQCIEAITKLVAAKPDADLLVRRGVCRHAKKDLKGEQKDYEQALKVNPSYAPAHYYLGRLLASQGKKDQAKQSLQKAADLGQGTVIAEKAKEALKGL